VQRQTQVFVNLIGNTAKTEFMPDVCLKIKQLDACLGSLRIAVDQSSRNWLKSLLLQIRTDRESNNDSSGTSIEGSPDNLFVLSCIRINETAIFGKSVIFRIT